MSLKTAIDECALADRYRLRGLLRKLHRVPQDTPEYRHGLADLEKQLARSKERCLARIAKIPVDIRLADSLPVSERADEIVELIKNHQVVVVAGETGSGKTTQLPKLCLQAGLGRYGMIGHTQPRRLAAISVANRIAEELGSEPGGGVGYQIRFADRTSDDSYLKLMTDGILLNEIQRDRYLNNYEVLIIDEAHERSLNIDFILGYLKQLLPKRPDLKLVITSATIDVEKFSEHFEGAPIVSVSGRTYPVEVRYAPLENQKEAVFDDDAQIEAVLSALREIEQIDQARNGPSDVLVFFSSEKEIRETALAIRKQRFKHVEVLPLYARLRQADQVKIFQPHKGRRVILATNIAETSLTVPGIRYVIDTGLARISRYSVQSKIQRLPIEPVSQASARQRSGRCGRIAEGVCIRLYSEQDFAARPEFTDPEIKRTNLAAVILQMLFLRLGNLGEFPFIDPPENKAVNDGYKLLFELGAIDENQRLTDTGRMMARLPVDPRFARMLIAGSKNSCLNEVAIVVSALSIQDPRETPADKRQAAREKHSAFDHADSDFLSLVKLWNEFEKNRQDLTHSQLRKFCSRNFLSYARMREWRETHRQLLSLCHQMRLNSNKTEGNYRDIHTAILVGSLNQVGSRSDGNEYLGSRNRKFRLLPGSTLAGKAPKWIVSGMIFETTQAYSSAAAKIEPEWIESVAGHLVRRAWSEPHWSKKRQRVMAYEKVTLYGLPIIERRQVPYGDIDPGACRDLFIREGLVAQQLQVSLPFYSHNLQLRAELEKQEEKLRKQSFFVDERRLEDYYEARLPEWVIDRASLLRWYGKAARRNPDVLTMRQEDLLPSDSSEALQRNFPDLATLHNNPLAVQYRFKPGSDADGATIQVPAPLLQQLSKKDLDWAIPGQLRDRSIHLLKTLPKALRKQLIPIPDFVDQALADLDPDRQELDLAAVLCEQARRIKGVRIDPQQLAESSIPEHLKVKIEVIDDSGKELANGADLDELKQRLLKNKQVRSSIHKESQRISHELEMSGLTDWILEELPEQVEVGDQLKLIRFPALIDEENSVSVQLLTDRLQAARRNREGAVRLLRLRTAQQSRELSRQFIAQQRAWGLKLPPFLAGKEVVEDFVFAVYCEGFQLRESLPRDKACFEQRLRERKSELFDVASQLTVVLDKIVERHFGLIRQMKETVNQNNHVANDVNSQLGQLLAEKYLCRVPFQWLREYPRYLQAIELRLERLQGQLQRDLQLSSDLQTHWQKLLEQAQRENTNLNTLVEDRPLLAQIRWMIEEYRVSLFAQQLRTRVPASAKRLNRLWLQMESSDS